MNKRLLVATLAVAALAPLAAHAGGGVTVSVSTPEFGFRIGAPVFGAPVFGPVPVYAPVVYAPPVIYRAPVFIPPPRVVYAPVFVPPPRIVYRPVPRYRHPTTRHDDDDRHYRHGYGTQVADYRVPPGHAKHQKGKSGYR